MVVGVSPLSTKRMVICVRTRVIPFAGRFPSNREQLDSLHVDIFLLSTHKLVREDIETLQILPIRLPKYATVEIHLPKGSSTVWRMRSSALRSFSM